MVLPQAGMDREELIEGGDDDEDPISTSEVTIPKPRKAKVLDSPEAPAMHEPPPARERHYQPRSSQETSKKRSSYCRRPWSPEECDTLRDLCYHEEEAFHQSPSPFWETVSAQLPGRTQGACYMKWRDSRVGRKQSKKTTTGFSGARDSGAAPGARWSAAEVKKLIQYCSPPGEPRHWAEVAAQFPGRSAQACNAKYLDISRAKRLEILMETQSQGAQASGAEDTTSDEPEEGNLVGQEAGGDTKMSSDGEL